MAKRGRPRKRGGLVRADLKKKELAPADGFDEREDLVSNGERGPSNGEDAGTRRSPGGVAALWGDLEKDLVENEVAEGSVERSPYLRALQQGFERGGDGIEADSKLIKEGDFPVNKGKEAQRSATSDDSEWCSVRLGSGAARRGFVAVGVPLAGESSGSRFEVLGVEGDW
ncbi:hypothetical protein Dimus_026282 [Dionaea muscipula]